MVFSFYLKTFKIVYLFILKVYAWSDAIVVIQTISNNYYNHRLDDLANLKPSIIDFKYYYYYYISSKHFFDHYMNFLFSSMMSLININIYSLFVVFDCNEHPITNKYSFKKSLFYFRILNSRPLLRDLNIKLSAFVLND